mmetsp:Transcript_76146/g.221087  ORF Transcript_76146/g.221087 Transcript_76146/m.221087 type:complete len:285 (-) Transcript_76146:1561-2415(-)
MASSIALSNESCLACSASKSVWSCDRMARTSAALLCGASAAAFSAGAAATASTTTSAGDAGAVASTADGALSVFGPSSSPVVGGGGAGGGGLEGSISGSGLRCASFEAASSCNAASNSASSSSSSSASGKSWASSGSDSIASRLSASTPHFEARCSADFCNTLVSCSHNEVSVCDITSLKASRNFCRSRTCLRNTRISSLPHVDSASNNLACASSSAVRHAASCSRASLSEACSCSSSASNAFWLSSRLLISSVRRPASLKLREATANFFSASKVGKCNRIASI